MAMSSINVPLGTLDGYVVMPLKEYDGLQQQMELDRLEAHKAHSLAAEATLKAKQDLESTLDNLCMIERECFGRYHIVVHFNEKAMLDLAMRKLVKTFSEEELAEYDVFTIDDFIIGDVTLCRRKPVEVDLAPGAETL